MGFPELTVGRLHTEVHGVPGPAPPRHRPAPLCLSQGTSFFRVLAQWFCTVSRTRTGSDRVTGTCMPSPSRVCRCAFISHTCPWAGALPSVVQLPHCHLWTAGRLQGTRPRGPFSPRLLCTHTAGTHLPPGCLSAPGGVPLEVPRVHVQKSMSTAYTQEGGSGAGRAGGCGFVPWFVGQSSGTKPHRLGPRAQFFAGGWGGDISPQQRRRAGGTSSSYQAHLSRPLSQGHLKYPAVLLLMSISLSLLPPRMSNATESPLVTLCVPSVSGLRRTFHPLAPVGIGPATELPEV